MNGQLYTSKGREKYILKDTSWQEIHPSNENMYLRQVPAVDKTPRKLLTILYPNTLEVVRTAQCPSLFMFKSQGTKGNNGGHIGHF